MSRFHWVCRVQGCRRGRRWMDTDGRGNVVEYEQPCPHLPVTMPRAVDMPAPPPPPRPREDPEIQLRRRRQKERETYRQRTQGLAELTAPRGICAICRLPVEQPRKGRKKYHDECNPWLQHRYRQKVPCCPWADTERCCSHFLDILRPLPPTPPEVREEVERLIRELRSEG